MNPYQPGEDNQDPYEVGYKAGAASRDAEVAKLKDDNEYLYVAAIERDQLHEQVKMLRALCTEGANGFGRILISTSDDVAVRDWQTRCKEALAKVRKDK